MKSNNYKNIAQTLTTRYQLKQSLFFAKSILYNTEENATGFKRVKEHFFNERSKTLLAAHFDSFDIEKDLFECITLWSNQIE